MHVLLLEDHPDTLRAYVGALRHAGHTSVSSGTVAEALLCLDAEAFDLLLSDGRLPDGNGCEVMASARQRHGMRGLVVSGHGDHEDVARYSAAGFDHVLIKPANFERILRAMNRVLTLPPLLSPPGTHWPTFPPASHAATGNA